jgi:hypothetical protein
MIDLQRIFNLSETNDELFFREFIEADSTLNSMMKNIENLDSYLKKYEPEEDELSRKIFIMPRKEGKLNIKEIRRITKENAGPLIFIEKTKNPEYKMTYFLPKAIKQKNGIINPFIRGNYEDIELPVLPERNEESETGIRYVDGSEIIRATYYFSKTSWKNFFYELCISTKINNNNYPFAMTIPVFRMKLAQTPYYVHSFFLEPEKEFNYETLKKIIENYLEPVIISTRNKKYDTPFTFFLPRMAKQEEGKIDHYIREEYFSHREKININEPKDWNERLKLTDIINKESIHTSHQ